MPFREAEGNIKGGDTGEPSMNPAQSKTPGMSGNSMRENRETPSVSGSSRSDRLEKATSSTASMHAGGESDEQVVPAKGSNKGEQSLAESVEGRSPDGGKAGDNACSGLCAGSRMSLASHACGSEL